MPNHTDVRATFYGHPDSIRSLVGACRLHALVDEDFRAAWVDRKTSDPWRSFKPGSATDFVSDPLVGKFPPTGSSAPFTLNVGVSMPSSMHVEESSTVKIAESVLNGTWRSQRGGHPDIAKLLACQTDKEALAWVQANLADELADAKTRIENVKAYGVSGWYDWSIKFWGTKWDAYDSSWSEPEFGGKLVEVAMQTAWSPPIPALSAMCEKFKIGCACSYVDEGGGFADYCVISTDGNVSEAGKDFGAAHSALRKETRRAAREGLRSMNIEESKKTSGWFSAIIEGNQPSPKALSSKGNPSARSHQTVDAILEAVCSGPNALASLSKALSALSAAGIAEPNDKSSSGIELGAAFAACHWLPGLQWAHARLAPEARVELAQTALWAASRDNNPQQALWALQDWNPGAAKLAQMCSQAPETSIALAGLFTGAERDLLVDSALSCLANPAPSSTWQRAPELDHSRVLAVMASSEKLKLMDATAESAQGNRAYPSRNL